MSDSTLSPPDQDPSAEGRTRVVLPPRYPPGPPLQTTAMTQFSREVRRCPGLRHELITQAQEGPDISAFERVLATAYGATLGFGVALSTPELLHWADRALDFRVRTLLDTTWDSTEYTPSAPATPSGRTRHSVQVRCITTNDPQWGHLATSYLLARGFPRSPKVQREIQLACARWLDHGGRQFFQLPQLRPRHQSRLLPPLEPEQMVLAYTSCTVSHLGGESPARAVTWVLALYRPGSDQAPLVGLFAWPLLGQARRSGQGKAPHELLAQMDPGEEDVRVFGVLGVWVDQRAVRRLMAEATNDPPDQA